MPNIIRDFHKDSFYHIYNRGLNKQVLFCKSADYERFLSKIGVYKEKFPSIKIYAYCLLPNHFHFLMSDETQNNEVWDSRSTLISEFMKGLQLSHAMYFTAQYSDSVKKGLKMPVYEGRFKAKLLAEDTYLQTVKDYIDNNAWKHEIVEHPQEWPYSSYHSKSRSTSILLGDNKNLDEITTELAMDFEF